MSVHDVVESAKAWLAAMEAQQEASDAFRAGCDSGAYERLTQACEAEKRARYTHLAAVKDVGNDGVADDERVRRLRTENEQLLDKLRNLREQVTRARENNEERNRELDALHYVWCNGGCTGGVHRYCGSPDDVTEEVVATAEALVKRLRSWYVNREHRRARGTT